MKQYKIEEGFEFNELSEDRSEGSDISCASYHYVTYAKDNNTEKYIRFYKIEQCMQFVDLLQEAGYYHQTKEEYKNYGDRLMTDEQITQMKMFQP